MLHRAKSRPLQGARVRVPVVDAEGLIGLKLQALVNAPSRRAHVRDQGLLRVPRKIKSLDEYLEFLAQIEALFGPIERPPRLSTGDHFLL